MYEQHDLVPGRKEDTYWFKEISVAFEHENNLDAGLYQEVSHLLITNSDLRILVTYPNRDPEEQLTYLHGITASTELSDDIAERQNFLIILGYQEGFRRQGRVFNLKNWTILE